MHTAQLYSLPGMGSGLEPYLFRFPTASLSSPLKTCEKTCLARPRNLVTFYIEAACYNAYIVVRQRTRN